MNDITDMNRGAIVPHHHLGVLQGVQRGSSSLASSSQIQSTSNRLSSNHASNLNNAPNMMNTGRPMTSNTMATSATAATGGRTTIGVTRIPPPTLLCNLCQKPLATTCFLCACDCIFCEECTYSHFEQSSQCPICRKTLTENDFIELVVAEATNNSTNDITKTTYQALFSKTSSNSSPSSSSNNVKGLPYSDICFSLIKQMDVVKQSSKFILKQLLMNSNTQNRKVAFVIQQNNKLKSDMTLLKQGQSTQRIQYEQINNELKNKLNARESTIQELNMKLKEKDKMLEQFRRLHRNNDLGNHNDRNGGHNCTGNDSVSISGGGQRSYHHQIPPSTGAISNMHGNSSGSTLDRHRGGHNRNHQSSNNSVISTITEPPLKGLMMQRQAHQMAQQKALVSSRRVPNIGLGRNTMNMSQHHHQKQQIQMPPPPPSTQPFTRPFSSNNSISSNSISSNTPRVRDLSHNTSFNFSGGSSSGNNSLNAGGGRLNKRRRSDNRHASALNSSSATPGAASHIMSPSTAFALNQGVNTVNRGPRWMQQREGDNYSVR